MKYFLDMENGKKFIAISIPSRYQEIRVLKIITKNMSSKISNDYSIQIYYLVLPFTLELFILYHFNSIMRIREIHESFDEICNYSSILHLENNYSYS